MDGASKDDTVDITHEYEHSLRDESRVLNNTMGLVVPKIVCIFAENSKKTMCQTMLISDSIVSLSKRSFARRLRTVSARIAAEKGVLTRLNNQLDELYELLYDNYPSITKDDYDSFKGNLTILLDTLKGLCQDYEQSPYHGALSDAISRLNSNRMALQELDGDIRYFRINLPRNPRYVEVIGRAKSL